MAKDVVPLQCVSTQFAFRAAAHPETLAVVDGDCCLTYGELARRVRILAAELQRRGVAVEDSVGLLLDRSPELYLGLLAVHLCGACYVPLDPAWPTQRHLFIATETECKIVLTVSSQAPPADLPAETILLDQFDWSQADRATGFPPPDLNRLAYILYTSGSTGVPKGVEIEHGSLANFVAWQNGTFPHLRNHRVSQAARPGFDASGSEIWPALCSGSTLYVIPAELLRNSAALAAWLTEQKIDECFLPTPLAELLLEQGLPNASYLRVLRTGGERLTRKPPADFPAILVNEYGPTECSIVSTYAVFYPGDDPLPPPDIGMPINRCKIYVMNDRLQMLPDGEVGEICISGIGLARGYHRRPDLDAVAFVANPLQPEERLYRTGDLGIRQQNGRFDYVGRMDFQVKLHGQRIELGEIETVIAAHPEVNKCVAQIRGGPGGAKRLVVYVTVRQRSSTITTELLSLARERLPEYMVPTAVVILDAFLLTAYGKIDRQALPEPTVTRKDWRAPEDKYARKIAALWQEQLQCPPPGQDDHFFHLGGDSLYAMVLAVRLGNEFDFAATATLLFQYPVLGNLAAFVKKNTGTGVSTGLKCDIDDAARRRFPVTSYQLSQWRLQQASGCGNMNNIVELIHLEGPLEPSLLERVLANIVAENQSLRSSFHWDGKQLWQSTADAVGAKLPLHDWSDEDQSCRLKKQPPELRNTVGIVSTNPSPLCFGPNYSKLPTSAMNCS